MRHHFAFTLTNQLALGQAVRVPNADTDLMTNMQWCYETNLFATEALAELLDLELPTVEEPEAARTRATTPVEHLADRAAHPVGRTRRGRRRVPPLPAAGPVPRGPPRRPGPGGGRQLVGRRPRRPARLLGHRPDDWFTGEEELERFVLADADIGAHDEDLLMLFHRRHLRAHALLGPPGSAMATHLPIQTFR